MINKLSNTDDIWNCFFSFPQTVGIATMSPYKVNKKHSSKWISLLLKGKTNEAKELSDKWVRDFAQTVYSHNLELQKTIVNQFASFEIPEKTLQVDSEVTAKVTIIFNSSWPHQN